MSAYMVDDATINRIVAGIQESMKSSSELPKPKNLLRMKPKDLGSHLFFMNMCSIDARYGNRQAQTFRDLNYRYLQEPTPNNAQLLKSIRNLLYQSCEGTASDEPLYQELNQWAEDMQEKNLVTEAEYDNAVWG